MLEHYVSRITVPDEMQTVVYQVPVNFTMSHKH